MGGIEAPGVASRGLVRDASHPPRCSRIADRGLCTNSQGVTGRVGDLDYEVGVARSLHVREADLKPYGQVSRHTPQEFCFAESAAYALRGVDPQAALVVPWAGDPRDDFGPIGECALLYRDLRQAAPAICAYFDPDHEATITGCR